MVLFLESLKPFLFSYLEMVKSVEMLIFLFLFVVLMVQHVSGEAAY